MDGNAGEAEFHLLAALRLDPHDEVARGNLEVQKYLVTVVELKQFRAMVRRNRKPLIKKLERDSRVRHDEQLDEALNRLLSYLHLGLG